MTRNTMSNQTRAQLPGAAAAPDPETALNDWLEWQVNLLGTGLGQMITLQQSLWSAWAAQIAAFTLLPPWPQAGDAGARPSTTAAAAPWFGLPFAAMPPLAGWWSAESPLWQRGAEQLG